MARPDHDPGRLRPLCGPRAHSDDVVELDGGCVIAFGQDLCVLTTAARRPALFSWSPPNRFRRHLILHRHTAWMSDASDKQTKAAGGITLYWRPGCGFCSGLIRQLDQLKVPYAAVNIWDDPSGAEFVRSVARGNETVPTVSVGPVSLVNPSAREVLDAAVIYAPSTVPANFTPKR
jgi:mycoredoxin